MEAKTVPARAPTARHSAANGRRAEKARRRAEHEQLFLEPETIQEFHQLRAKLDTFHSDFTALSTKFPANKVSPILVRLLNGALKQTTVLLGATHRPFPTSRPSPRPIRRRTATPCRSCRTTAKAWPGSRRSTRTRATPTASGTGMSAITHA